MRIRSVHPRYLDSKGLVALWRETLLAKHVLEGKTKAYRNHPQLIRFKSSPCPLSAINEYLSFVLREAESRGYNFSREKIDREFTGTTLTVTTGQLEYERAHLLLKLKIRDPQKFSELSGLKGFEPHPLFISIGGDRENWEIIS